MTAEIVIMNSDGVALAADSAATVLPQKIFGSASKIFHICKDFPIGIMIYNNSCFLGIPWETIIGNVRRTKLCNESYSSLEEFANNFLDILSNLMNDDIEISNYRSITFGLISEILSEYNDLLNIIRIKGNISKEESINILSTIIFKNLNQINNSFIYCDNFSEDDYSDELKKINEEIINYTIKSLIEINNQIITEFVIKDIPSELIEAIREIIPKYFFMAPKRNCHPGATGLVITGFGEDENYPSCFSYELVGRINNKLIMKKGKVGAINFNCRSSIMPFAQHEMIDLFMQGVDSQYEKIIEKIISDILIRSPINVIESLDQYLLSIGKENFTPEQLESLKKENEDYANKQMIEIKNYLSDLRKSEYIEKITSLVAVLPKDELAVAAETLINLTSFKRRVTFDAETVGGPIDVAIISKKDGFIWIKRKHYFDEKLNPHFMRRK